jgi:hypothetical protein
MQTLVIALGQNAVDYRDMGVATSANTFFRSLGSKSSELQHSEQFWPNRLGHHLVSSGFDPAQAGMIEKNTAAIAALPLEGKNQSSRGLCEFFPGGLPVVAAPVARQSDSSLRSSFAKLHFAPMLITHQHCSGKQQCGATIGQSGGSSPKPLRRISAGGWCSCFCIILCGSGLWNHCTNASSLARLFRRQ